MGKALEVLKVHVMELERVNDLCKDFCERYIGDTLIYSELCNSNLPPIGHL